ncbi:flagellar basal-body MS-ring/collar protein FliF [Anaerotignum sp. MB30-C6]|uniref:flagellar basal-body MS-ring/collar protein FliF n=1 Tax=Anaerotignum sp. MB30-C6 TaxID=3070814 RepID=UPI0027DC4632|nr:flagellar basal-body MS-ring/collar protein FliF [Anaerotignum sp. MB30-C6]WMI81432.1 flagellar basal-body MS-ring/collar protein FliF [Anaerotignum sp. MB30-C6]
MNTKLKELVEKGKYQYQKITPKARKLILGGTCLVILFSIGIAIFLNNKPFETLFSGLNQQEASEIIEKLQGMGVDYKYGNDGVISVPKEQEEKLKAQLVYEGYPKSGFTYDVFKENIGMTTTDFEKNSYKLFELQNRMGATIRLFQGVKDAKVTIALAEDQKYVLNEKSVQKAQASIVVIMEDGGSPTAEQVKGIQRLVSKSIPSMEMTDVVVLDGNGNDVSSNGDSIAEGANRLKLEFEKHMDDAIRTKILTVLSPIYGADNVKVSVRTTVDVDKKIREIINHETPIEGSEKGIPGTESSGLEVVRDGNTAGGVPGTQSNAEVPTYTQVERDDTESYYKEENTIDYLVNQLTEQAQIDSGSIKDISVSVAINNETIGNITERDLRGLIGNAAGIEQESQADKIAIVAAPFFESSPLPANLDDIGRNNWIIIGAIATGVLLIILVIVILIISKRRKRKKQMAAVDVKREPSISPDAYLKQLKQKQQEDAENKILNLSNEKGLELKNKVRDLAGENPEISAQLIRTWLRGGE